MEISRFTILRKTGKHMASPMFCVFMDIIGIAALIFDCKSTRDRNMYIVAMLVFSIVYCFYSQGYVLDVLFKSIKATPPITAENITLGGHIEGVVRGKFFGGGFTVTDSAGKSVNLKLYNDALDTKLGVEFKFYYLKRSKVVVGAETLRFNKKIDQSRKGRKSK